MRPRFVHSLIPLLFLFPQVILEDEQKLISTSYEDDTNSTQGTKEADLLSLSTSKEVDPTLGVDLLNIGGAVGTELGQASHSKVSSIKSFFFV